MEKYQDEKELSLCEPLLDEILNAKHVELQFQLLLQYRVHLLPATEMRIFAMEYVIVMLIAEMKQTTVVFQVLILISSIP